MASMMGAMKAYLLECFLGFEEGLAFERYNGSNEEMKVGLDDGSIEGKLLGNEVGFACSKATTIR